MIDDEVGKYRKKSKAKGQPRSKHKHIYDIVLLTRHFEIPNKYGGKSKHEDVLPAKVCTICGRIDDILFDAEYFDTPRLVYPRNLSEKALKLPRWYCNYFDKFATPEEELNE